MPVPLQRPHFTTWPSHLSLSHIVISLDTWGGWWSCLLRNPPSPRAGQEPQPQRLPLPLHVGHVATSASPFAAGVPVIWPDPLQSVHCFCLFTATPSAITRWG